MKSNSKIMATTDNRGTMYTNVTFCFLSPHVVVSAYVCMYVCTQTSVEWWIGAALSCQPGCLRFTEVKVSLLHLQLKERAAPTSLTLGIYLSLTHMHTLTQEKIFLTSFFHSSHKMPFLHALEVPLFYLFIYIHIYITYITLTELIWWKREWFTKSEENFYLRRWESKSRFWVVTINSEFSSTDRCWADSSILTERQKVIQWFYNT